MKSRIGQEARADGCVSMSSASVCFLVVMICLVESARSAVGDTLNPDYNDPCTLASDDMVLEKTWVQGDDFIGLFKVRFNMSRTPEKPLILDGWRKDGRLFVTEPYSSFEFKDVRGHWTQLTPSIGSYVAAPDHLAVPFGGSGEVTATLPWRDVAEYEIEWRLVLRSADNKECLKSFPFKVVQEKGPVTGFLSRPIPYWWNQKPRTSGCPAPSSDTRTNLTTCGYSPKGVQSKH